MDWSMICGVRGRLLIMLQIDRAALPTRARRPIVNTIRIGSDLFAHGGHYPDAWIGSPWSQPQIAELCLDINRQEAPS